MSNFRISVLLIVVFITVSGITLLLEKISPVMGIIGASALITILFWMTFEYFHRIRVLENKIREIGENVRVSGGNIGYCNAVIPEMEWH